MLKSGGIAENVNISTLYRDVSRITAFAGDTIPVYMRTQAYDMNICMGGVADEGETYDPYGPDAGDYMQRWNVVEGLQRRIHGGEMQASSILDERVLRRTFGAEPSRLEILRSSLLLLREIVDAEVQNVGIATTHADFRFVLGGSFNMFNYRDGRTAIQELTRAGDVLITEDQKSFDHTKQAYTELWRDQAVITNKTEVVRYLGGIIRDVEG